MTEYRETSDCPERSRGTLEGSNVSRLRSTRTVLERLVLASLAAGLSACMTAPPPPAAPYHALGTEPFWNLLIDEHNLTFTQPDAQPVLQPTPKVIIGFAGEIYQTPRIHVNIVHARC